jgi:hypothetical protein
VSFTGASGLTLGTSDFTVTGGGTIGAVKVSNDTASVTVNFKRNTTNAQKIYTVSIRNNGLVIKGDAKVSITQNVFEGNAALPEDNDGMTFATDENDESDGDKIDLTDGDESIDSSDKVTISKTGERKSFTATVSEDESSDIRWYMDSVPLNKESSSSITIYAVDYNIGAHRLNVVVKNGNEGYSTEINLEVID